MKEREKRVHLTREDSDGVLRVPHMIIRDKVKM